MAVVGILGQTGGAAVQAVTGTGSRSGAGAISVTGVGFQPDMVIIRGSPMTVKSNEVGDVAAFTLSPAYSGTTVSITSFDIDGFSAILNSYSGYYSYTWCAYKFS